MLIDQVCGTAESDAFLALHASHARSLELIVSRLPASELSLTDIFFPFAYAMRGVRGQGSRSRNGRNMLGVRGHRAIA